MGSKERKDLKAKLLVAIKKVLQKDNKAELTNKSKKSLKKSIKEIVKKSNKRKSVIATKRKARLVLKPDKIKMDGVSAV